MFFRESLNYLKKQPDEAFLVHSNLLFLIILYLYIKIPEMKRLPVYIICFLFSFNFIVDAQKDVFTIMFYNVENLFDTINSHGIDDKEFTPEGEKKWNTAKYYKKLEGIARVIGSVNPDGLPEIIGLAEVENRAVLNDLVKTTFLSKGNYGIIHEDGPDTRGIDVALLYRKDRFKYISHKSILVTFPFDSTMKTRDILYVSGTPNDGKELHFFVNHWSSRQGGVKKSEPGRMFAAVTLRRNIDLLLSRDSQSRIIIMGDLNDEPTNQSVMNVLHAANKRKNIGPADLYNLFYDKHNLGNSGSYYFNGAWSMLDQIIVSYNLLGQKNLFSCDYDSGKVFLEDWMLYENKEGKKIPDRTYGGPVYYGGVSDHLPVYIQLTK